MTMQNETEIIEDVQPSEIPDAPPIDTIDDSIIDTSNAQVEVSALPADAPQADAQASPPPPVEKPDDTQMAILAQQNAALQQQVNQWSQWQQQQQQERSFQENANAMRQQLEQNGYNEETINLVVAQQQVAQRREAELLAINERQRLADNNKYNAALYYAQTYGVDPQSLMGYDSPKEMEARASDAARIAKLEAKISRYEKASVPSQGFENGTSQVNAVSNEQAWMDRYSAGDRSPQAVSAAKRAAGKE